MTDIQGTYQLQEWDEDTFLDHEIVVLRYAPPDHNGKGVHYHAVGDTTGYGWMSLKYLKDLYTRN